MTDCGWQTEFIIFLTHLLSAYFLHRTCQTAEWHWNEAQLYRIYLAFPPSPLPPAPWHLTVIEKYPSACLLTGSLIRLKHLTSGSYSLLTHLPGGSTLDDIEFLLAVIIQIWTSCQWGRWRAKSLFSLGGQHFSWLAWNSRWNFLIQNSCRLVLLVVKVREGITLIINMCHLLFFSLFWFVFQFFFFYLFIIIF